MNTEEAARAWDVLWRDQKDDVATRAGVIRLSAFTRDLPYWNGIPLQWREPLRATLEADMARRKAAETARVTEIEKQERAELARLLAKYGTAQETRPALDMSAQPMGDPHPIDLVRNRQCPICGGIDACKPGCEDGSEHF